MRPQLIPILPLILLTTACSSPTTPTAETPTKPAVQTTPPPVYRVKLATSKGDITIEARREWAPLASDRFYELTRTGFYNDARFFRVLRKFIAQFGVAADPKLMQLWNAKPPLMDDKRVLSNQRGTLSFAKVGPNSRRTQVFINLADNTKALDSDGFTPFAKIVDGLPIADELYAKYGELESRGGAGPDPTKLELMGNAYLIRLFGSLDYIKTAEILP
ncbi:MAG: peptidylprolyl isomerase [Bryobacterales bacterium]|nr:peptidylprolyl isomerase [Bryobacterales bacterium]